MTRKSSFGPLLDAVNYQQKVIKVLRPISKYDLDVEGLLETSLETFNSIVVEFLDRYLEKVQVKLDPKKNRSWDDPHALLQVEYDGLSIRIPVKVIENLNGKLAKRIKAKMAKKIEVNGVVFELPLDEEVEVKVEYSPLAPYYRGSCENGSNWGNEITEIQLGVYFVHDYDKSKVSGTYWDEKYQEWNEGWYNLDDHTYTLIITIPELVGKPLEDFSPKDQALFKIVKILREMGYKPDKRWKFFSVDELPENRYETGGTPVSSSYGLQGEDISDSLHLIKCNGYTGSRSEFSRGVYALKSVWPELG